MNRDEALHAAEILGSSPAANWIGTKFTDDGSRLIQKCMRCSAEEELELPAAAAHAFRTGVRGDAVAKLVPQDFDTKIFSWKRAFQRAHERCEDIAVS
jgi:hypothetical protein